MAPYDHTRPADQNSLWEESQTAFIMAPPLRLSGLAPLRNIPPTHRAAFTTGRPTTLDLPLTVISPRRDLNFAAVELQLKYRVSEAGRYTRRGHLQGHRFRMQGISRKAAKAQSRKVAHPVRQQRHGRRMNQRDDDRGAARCPRQSKNVKIFQRTGCLRATLTSPCPI